MDLNETISIMTSSIVMLSVAFKCYDECGYADSRAEFCFAEYLGALF